MRHSKTERVIAVSLGVGLLVLLSCGLLATVVQQRVITLADMNVQLGPLSLRTHAPQSSICPEKADPLTNVCDRFSASPRPAYYRVLLFWNSSERGAPSRSVLASWTIPVRDAVRDERRGGATYGEGARLTMAR
jgi:hypothetical protein